MKDFAVGANAFVGVLNPTKLDYVGLVTFFCMNPCGLCPTEQRGQQLRLQSLDYQLKNYAPFHSVEAHYVDFVVFCCGEVFVHCYGDQGTLFVEH